MSVSVLTMPAAGWYPDPAGAATFRWWDGMTWTEGTHVGSGATGIVPEQLFADPEPQPEPVFVATEPAVAEPPAASAARRHLEPAKTRWSSLLTAFPVVYPLVVGMVAALAYAGGAASSMPTLVSIAAGTALLGLVPAFVLAEYDRRELVERGYEPAPSLAWMLLLPPIAYLIARRRLVGR